MTRKAIMGIDKTLWHFCDALYEELRKINGSFRAPGSWTHWDMWEKHCSLDEFLWAPSMLFILIGTVTDTCPIPRQKNSFLRLKKTGITLL